jgi:hypothetical protein
VLQARGVAFSSRAPKAALAALLLGGGAATATRARSPRSAHRGEAEAAVATGTSRGSKRAAGAEAHPGAEAVQSEAVQSEAAVVVPGTRGLLAASAAEAAKEKEQAGENRAVEHVALREGDVAGNLL